MAARKAAAVSSEISGSRHWFGVLVNIWIAVAPMAVPRGGAVWTPPWIETWAPRRSGGAGWARGGMWWDVSQVEKEEDQPVIQR